MFLALAALAVLPLWVGHYMPLVDLPQHAAQLAIGLHWGDPAYGYERYYEVNWLTNQLLAYTLTRGFMLFLPLVPALKCVLSVAVVGLAGSVLWLVRTLRGNDYWSLLAFPIGYSFSLYWGFLNFVITIPVAIALIVLATRYVLAPSRGALLALAALTWFLFFSHVLALAFAGLVAVGLVVLRAPGVRAKLLGGAALASVLPVVAAWWATIQGLAPSTTATPTMLDWGSHRFLQFFCYQVGLFDDRPLDVLCGVLLLALPFALGGRPAREVWRWLPLVICVAAFWLVPLSAIEVDLIYGRFAVFALPCLLFALDARGPTPAPARTAAVGLVALQLASVAYVFAAFGAEARPLQAVLERAAPHKRLLFLPTDASSQVTFEWPYAHFGAWYQVERGGTADFSFAEFFPMWYRYKPELVTGLPMEFDSHPERFRWALHGRGRDGTARYDYLLVRGPLLPEWSEGSALRLLEVTSAGDWKLLEASEAPTIAER